MAYFIFIDESGHDRKNSPYEVLAGIAIKDSDLWNLISRLQELEIKHFGRRYSNDTSELKAKKIIKTKTFRLAKQLPPIPLEERRLLAKECLDDGEHVTKKQLTALSQSKIEYTKEVLKLASQFRCKIFASIYLGEDNNGSKNSNYLRKDYVYFFERVYYFLEDKKDSHQGILVFDELDKSQSHILLGQIDNYFKKTENGRLRSNLVIPEPFFVHSDLTTGIQLVDLVAYIISWGLRFGNLSKPAREELNDFVDIVKLMRYKTIKDFGDGVEISVWSVVVV